MPAHWQKNVSNISFYREIGYYKNEASQLLNLNLDYIFVTINKNKNIQGLIGSAATTKTLYLSWKQIVLGEEGDNGLKKYEYPKFHYVWIFISCIKNFGIFYQIFQPMILIQMNLFIIIGDGHQFNVQ